MTSSINPLLPEDNVPALKADLRANLQAAKDEIEALQARQVPAGGGTGQVLKKLSGADFHFDWGTDETGTGSGNFGDEVVLVDAQSGSDDLAKINNAITAAKNSGKPLWFSKRQYDLDGKPGGIADWSNFIWYGNGAVLKAGDVVPNNSGGSFLTFTRCSQFNVVDLIVDGNNAVRGTIDNFSGHNFQLIECNGFIFQNVASKNGSTDGWRVSSSSPGNVATFPSGGKWVNCTGHNNGRNGISFIEALDMLVLGGDYSENSHRPPMAGIDIEPNSGSAEPGCARINIIGVRFYNNANCGVMVTRGGGGNAGVGPVLIEGCVFDANGGRDALAGTNQSHAPLYIDNRFGCTVRGNHFINCTFDGSGTPLLRGVAIYLAINTAGPVLVEGNFFSKNSGIPVSSFDGTIAGHSNLTGEVAILNNVIDLRNTARQGIRAPMARAQVNGNRVIGDGGSGTGIVMSGADGQAVGNYVVGTANYGSATVAGNVTVGA